MRLQIAWITLVLQQHIGYPSHCLGAVLTSHRVLITDGKLSALQAVPVAEPELSALHSITSLLWAGPALLLCHAAGRVELLLLSGRRVHVASLARLGSYAIVSAVGDRLTFAHRRGERVLIAARRAALGQLVMQAWLALLESGHPFGTWPNVRLELQQLVKSYNVAPAGDAALAHALLAAGCGDLVQPCTSFANESASMLARCAHAAASSQWDHATDQVLQVRRRAGTPTVPDAPAHSISRWKRVCDQA